MKLNKIIYQVKILINKVKKNKRKAEKALAIMITLIYN